MEPPVDRADLPALTIADVLARTAELPGLYSELLHLIRLHVEREPDTFQSVVAAWALLAETGNTGKARALLAMSSLLVLAGQPVPFALRDYLCRNLLNVAVGDPCRAANALNLRGGKGRSRTAENKARELTIALHARRQFLRLNRWRDDSSGAPGACERTAHDLRLPMTADRVEDIHRGMAAPGRRIRPMQRPRRGRPSRLARGVQPSICGRTPGAKGKEIARFFSCYTVRPAPTLASVTLNLRKQRCTTRHRLTSGRR